ncbi:MAG: flippase-like domain-containing protein [Bacteroidia bacterium]|nr:flippase-like domain-containing protein [Bacteroidia bacterium]
MKARLKSLLQYAIIILITSALIWVSLRGLIVGEGENKTDFLWQTWEKSNKGYLVLMGVLAMASHLIRSIRWQMLLAPLGYTVGLGNSFLSIMIGYLVNLAIPRGGEVSRCYNLYKLDKTPPEISFGTVVAERVVDIMFLLLLIGASFVAEWDKLTTFLSSLDVSTDGFTVSPWIIIGAVVIASTAIFLFFRFRKNEKLRKILGGFKEGLLAVFQLKNKSLFVFYSLAIWGFYFLMSWAVIKAFPETSTLGFSAVLTLFALGTIAMTVPLPGGAGSYHTIVPLGLVMLYNLPKPDAIAFVFVFHAWQTLIMIVAGVVSLIISYLIIRWRKPEIK